MKEKVVKKMVEIEETQYIAEDGTVFEDAYECEEYEEDTRDQRLRERVEELHLSKLDDIVPPINIYDEDFKHYYYVVKTTDDLDNLREFCESEHGFVHDGFEGKLTFPFIIIVQVDKYNNDVYFYHLDSIKNYMEEYLEQINDVCNRLRDEGII